MCVCLRRERNKKSDLQKKRKAVKRCCSSQLSTLASLQTRTPGLLLRLGTWIPSTNRWLHITCSSPGGRIHHRAFVDYPQCPCSLCPSAQVARQTKLL